MKKGMIVLVFAAMLTGAGCSGTELENSSYPMTIGVEEKGYTMDFPDLAKIADQNAEGEGRTAINVKAKDLDEALKEYETETQKSIDCGHVKSLIFSKRFVMSEKWDTFLEREIMQQKLARNIPVFICKEEMEGLFQAEQTEDSLGAYLEGLVKKGGEGKCRAVTLGNILEQKCSKDQVLFIPVIESDKDKIKIRSYLPLQYFEWRDPISERDRRIAAILQGQSEEYDLYGKKEVHVAIQKVSVSRKFQRKGNQLLQQIRIEGEANGMGYQGNNRQKERYAVRILEKQFKETVERQKAQGVDLTDSWFYQAKERKWKERDLNQLQTSYKWKLFFRE